MRRDFFGDNEVLREPLKVYRRFFFCFFFPFFFLFLFYLSPYVGGGRFHDAPLPLLFQPPQKASVNLRIQVTLHQCLRLMNFF